MRTIVIFAGSLLMAVGTAAGAQPMPQSHEQHQASSAQPEQASVQGRCCCEEMMQKHQGTGMSSPMSPGQDQPQPEQHKH